jgi:hypothetical protein
MVQSGYYPILFFTIQSLSVFSAICALKFPIFYKTLFNERQWRHLFIGTHAIAFFAAVTIGKFCRR